ncbi:RecX family transcriptional regulator [Coprothermobacteraceae bacterium]|nr:RecX family transcriptional regulator [Coprothermobacteraceae bacterium]
MADCEKFWHMVIMRLSKRDYSKAELLAKVPAECVDVISAKLDEMFPDLDQRVASTEVSRAVSLGKGPLYVKERLYRRRVEAAPETYDATTWGAALRQALSKARRKYTDDKKIMEFLLRQGFTYEMTRQRLKEVEDQ